MILDLTVFKEETLDVKIAEDKVIHIRKPTQEMVIRIMQMRDISEDTPPEEIMRALNRIALDILNHNDEGIVFTDEHLSKLPQDGKLALLNAYTAFVTKLQSNPT